MKKWGILVLLLCFLTGCDSASDDMETAMELRTRLLQSSGCSFRAAITADYGDQIHQFSMTCSADPQGDMTFTVTEPDSISGISGKLTGKGGEITFDDTALHFALLAEEQLSPISSPWILLHTLRSGCLTCVCREEGSLRISMDDSFEEDPLHLDIWLDSENHPEHADILYGGKRILSVAVTDFRIL